MSAFSIATPQKKSGFTIVELLIVIVIIGILAAITIVSFNGIQDRAKTAAAQAAAVQANQKILAATFDNADNYPVAAGVNGIDNLAAIGITNNGDTTYQYSADNTVSPKTFCLTTTKDTKSSYISNATTTPQTGGCPGHGVGGVAAITNLATNPSVEATTGNWGYYLAGGAATASRGLGGGYTGSNYFRLTWTAASTVVSGGFYPYSMGAGTITANATYMGSVYVRTSKNQTMFSQMQFKDAGNTTLNTVNGPVVTVQANVWTRLSTSAVAPTNAYSGLLTAYAFSGGTMWQPGDTLDGDGAMLTAGSTLYNYADGGSSSSWVWNGAANASTSTGPVL